MAPSSTLVWVVAVALSAGVYALRLSFIHLHGVVEGFPSGIERALTFIPAAILAALITPELFVLEGTLGVGFANARILAGSLALATALRTGSMIATIGVGMGVLWTITFLLG